MRTLFTLCILLLSLGLVYGQCTPTYLTLTYDLDAVALGDTVDVTWDSDCDSAVMNISLGSLPPLPYRVQQVDNKVANSGTRSFVIGTDLALGEYLFYIEDVDQTIWDYGDTFRIESQIERCDYPSTLSLTYELDVQHTGDEVEVTWDADCQGAVMNTALVSLPPLPYQVQQINYGITNLGLYTFAIDSSLAEGNYQFYVEDLEQNIWDYGDTFRIETKVDECDFPSTLDLTYAFDVQRVGDTVNVTWDGDCEDSRMNVSLVSLPPLRYQVQQVDNDIENNGSRSFVIDLDLLAGDYQFYIEDVDQNIWDYGDTFRIERIAQGCDSPSPLELTYDFQTQQAGDTVLVTWDADCDESVFNVALVSLPPLEFAVQQIIYGVENTGSLLFAIDVDTEPGDYQFYIEQEDQLYWNYGDTFLIEVPTTSVSIPIINSPFYYSSTTESIMWEGVLSKISFELFDYSGRLVLNADSTGGFIDVSSLVSGTYFIRGSDGSLLRFAK